MVKNYFFGSFNHTNLQYNRFIPKKQGRKTMKEQFNLKKMILTALFTALTCIATMLI